MPDTSYQQYHHSLIETLTKKIKQTPPFNSEDLDEAQQTFLNKLDDILNNSLAAHERTESGQWLINAIVANYQHLMTDVPRDLFWYFGGDCLHYLEDHEISYFQNLDEAYHDAATSSALDYATLVHTMKQSNKSIN